MRHRIRCGIIGTEHPHALRKIAAIRKSEDYELEGIHEPNGLLLSRRRNDVEYADIRWLAEDDLLGDSRIEMIAVETHVGRLLHHAQNAVRAGKHIHLDKPAGTSLSQFRTVLDESRRRGLLVQLGYMFRYNDGFILIKSILQEGRLGDIHYIHGCINSSLKPEDRARVAFHPGGMMFELGCHLIDILVSLLGRPEKVTPFLRHDGASNDSLADNTLAVFEYARAVAVIESSALETGAWERRKFEVCGNRGTVVLHPLEPPAASLFLPESHGNRPSGWRSIEIPNTARYVRDLEELARCIRGEQAFPYTVEHDYLVQETLLRACGSGTGAAAADTAS